MLNRSRSRYNGRNLPATFLQEMASYGAIDAWDFVNQYYLRDGRVSASGITTTRASVGYAQRSDGIWQSFGNNEPRITDKGLLVEGSRINRALYSRDLTNPAWTATNVTVARNQVGIDGTANSACSLTATASNGTVLQAVTHASTGRYFSIWVKRITGTGTVEVTLDNGSTWTGVTVTSGWTRVGAAQTLANPTVGVRLVTDTDAIAVDFAQLEDGAFPSSPILVEGTAVTRALDMTTATLSGVSYPLSTFVEIDRIVAAGSTQVGFIVDTGNQTNYTALNIVSNGEAAAVVFANSASQAAGSVPGVLAVGLIHRIAARVAVNDVRPVANGALGFNDTSANLPTNPTTARFGVFSNNFNPSFQYIRRAAIIRVALDNANLQAITT